MSNEEILKEIKRIRGVKKSDELYDAIKIAQEIQVKLRHIARLTPDMPIFDEPLVQGMDAISKLLKALRDLEKTMEKEEESE